MDDDDRWLNTVEAATYTKYSVHTLRDAASTGELKGHRRPTSRSRGHYRFKVKDLDRWLTSSARRGSRGKQ